MSVLKTIGIQHLNGSSPNIQLDSSGNVGVGVSSPGARLDVKGGSSDNGTINITNNSGNIWKFWNDLGSSGMNIQYNGTTRMVIDSSGRVTTPYQPSFLAGSNSGTHTINDGNLLDFNTSLLNNGNHYNTSTYAFTAPVAGLYHFYFQLYVQNGASQKSIAWKKNGSQYTVSDTAIAFQGPTNISDFTLNSTIIFNLNASDYIQIAVRSGSGNLQWYAGHSWFLGYLLG